MDLKQIARMLSTLNDEWIILYFSIFFSQNMYWGWQGVFWICLTLWQRSANFFCKGPANSLGFADQLSVGRNSAILAALDKRKWLCVAVSQWNFITLKVEFHIIFRSQNIVLIFLQTLKKYKLFWAIGPMEIYCMPDLAYEQ